jgi:hypothetical protein
MGYKESKFINHYKGECAMKTKLPIVAVVAILVSACNTGTYMTKNYDDGIYFTPADQPPVAVTSNQAVASAREKSATVNAPDSGDQSLVMSQMSKNQDCTSSVNNYIYQPGKNTKNSDVHAYNMDNQELTDSDTTAYYNDDDVKYVINNYYDDNEDIDYTYRIGRFYRPFYNPFFYDDWYYGAYSPWYSGYYGLNWGIGLDPWYYGGWGYPYGYGYYSPYYLGLSAYWGFGYPYYGGYWGGGYYGGYWGGHYYDTHQVAQRRSTNMNMAGGGLGGGASFSPERAASLKSGTLEPNNRTSNTWVENGHVRSRTINGSADVSATKAATIVNDRRSATNPDGTRRSNIVGSQVQESQDGNRATQIIRQGSENTGHMRRSYAPETTSRTYTQQRAASESQNYTPSYSKPRIVNQSNFNNGSYARPRTYNSPATQTLKSAGTNRTQVYSAPRSSSSIRQTYRSSSSYNSGSSSSSYRSATPASTYTPGSYSAPARSSSSYSGGGGGYSGGGSSSGGGGGSGHRR